MVAESERRVYFYLVFRLVLPVAAPALGLPELHCGQRVIAHGFGYIIPYAV